MVELKEYKLKKGNIYELLDLFNKYWKDYQDTWSAEYWYRVINIGKNMKRLGIAEKTHV
jgi:hypothetical protein